MLQSRVIKNGKAIIFKTQNTKQKVKFLLIKKHFLTWEHY